MEDKKDLPEQYLLLGVASKGRMQFEENCLFTINFPIHCQFIGTEIKAGIL